MASKKRPAQKKPAIKVPTKKNAFIIPGKKNTVIIPAQKKPVVERNGHGGGRGKK